MIPRHHAHQPSFAHWFLFVCLLTPMAVGQDADSPATPSPPVVEAQEDAKTLMVYRLDHTDGTMVAQLSVAIVPECMLAIDVRTNSLIVHATPEDHDRMKELIETLDVPSEPDHVIKVFSLAHGQAESMANVLMTLVDEKTRVSIDEKTNSIIARGPAESLEVLEALLLRLDQSTAPEADESATYQIRVIWLVSGLGEGEGGVMPAADLQGVIEELAKLDVQPFRQVGQVTVNTVADGEFKVQCSPDLNQQPVSLRVSGQLSRRQGQGELEISIEAADSASDSADTRQLANIETTIRLPDGHFAVLGTTPIGRVTSVFVVQVTAGEK